MMENRVKLFVCFSVSIYETIKHEAEDCELNQNTFNILPLFPLLSFYWSLYYAFEMKFFLMCMCMYMGCY